MWWEKPSMHPWTTNLHCIKLWSTPIYYRLFAFGTEYFLRCTTCCHLKRVPKGSSLLLLSHTLYRCTNNIPQCCNKARSIPWPHFGYWLWSEHTFSFPCLYRIDFRPRSHWYLCPYHIDFRPGSPLIFTPVSHQFPAWIALISMPVSHQFQA